MPGPSGHAWGPSTIRGNRGRGTGILNNELYIGRLVWNRLRYIKDPDTGKRVSPLNPEGEWVVHEVPDLRIIDDALWRQVKERQQALSYGPLDGGPASAMNGRRRPKHLLAGLVTCGCCGGGYTLISADLLGCATARRGGFRSRCAAAAASRAGGVAGLPLPGRNYRWLRGDALDFISCSQQLTFRLHPPDRVAP